MDYSIRENTYNILKDFKYIYNGIDYGKSIILDIAYDVATNRSYKTPLSKILLHLACPYVNNNFDKQIENNRYIFSCYVVRRDYDQLIDYAKDGLSDAVKVHLTKAFKRKPHLMMASYIPLFKALKKINGTFRLKLFIASRLVSYISAIETLEGSFKLKEIDFCTKRYIPFNSSFGLENVLTQFFNNKGSKTFHLCHGLHYAPNYKFFSIDAFNKELITANTVLSWSQSFVDNDQIGYNHEIVGNPKYPYKKIQTQIHDKKAIVLLARGQYDENNMMLLDEIGKFSKTCNTEFVIKPHPTDDIGLVQKKCVEYGFTLCKSGTVSELLSGTEFGYAISYETTSYFEAMYFNLVCFRFAYMENECYGEFDDRFMNGEELGKQVSKYMLMDKQELSDKIAQCLVYEIGMGINRYKEVISC